MSSPHHDRDNLMKAPAMSLRCVVISIAVVLLIGCGPQPEVQVSAPMNQALQATPGPPAAALLVVGALPPSAADAELLRTIEAAGLTAQMTQAVDAKPSDAAGRAVVVISESCNSGDVGDKFAQTGAGVVVSEPAVWDDMMMVKVDAVWSSDYGDLNDQQDVFISDSNHPALKSLGIAGSQRVSHRPSKFVWAKPEPTALVGATLSGQPSKAAFFTYERGVQMAGLEAPGRRAGIFAGRDTPEYFSAIAKSFVTSVIRWAATPRALLIVKETSLSPGDQKLEDLVKNRGFAVRRVRASSIKASDFKAVALGVVSESTQSTDLSDQQRLIFATTPVPLIMFEPALWDDAKMTGPTWGTDFGNMAGASQIQFLPDANEQLLSAGMSGTVQATASPQTFLWGRTFGAGVRKVATLVGQPEKVALFAYERNAALVDGTLSPGRRVGLFADRDATADLTDQGSALIVRAVDWASATSVRVGQTLKIVHACRVPGAQTLTAAFVYENLGQENLYLARGAGNSAQPSPLSDSLPVWFAPGRHAVMLSSGGQPEIHWKLGESELAVSLSSSVCSTADGADGEYLVVDGLRTLLTIGGDTAAAGAIVPSDVEVAGQVLEGEASVGHDGASSYSMPIWLPPAPGGKPSLTLQYKSSRSNERNILGAGFGLGGLSEIRRCPKTFNRDGQPGSVTFRSDDAFCMDGLRLVKVGETESMIEYRTEVDVFARIVAHGKGNSGPEFFEVKGADGSTSLFGDTADSKLRGERRIQKPGLPTGNGPSFTTEEVTLAWGVHQRTDVAGWTTTYQYELVPSSPPFPGIEWRIADISYGGNVKSQRVADRKVHFAYQARSDVPAQPVLRAFQSGFLRLYTSLLASVDVHGPSSTKASKMLRQYKVDYTLGSEKQALVKAVRACDEFGICTRPTKFEWQEETSDKFETIKTGVTDLTRPGLENYWALHSGDFNGDGYSDILYRRLTNSETDHGGPSDPKVFEDWVIRFSDGNVFGPPQSVGDSELKFDTKAQVPYRGFFSKLNFGVPIDLNGDSLTDFLGIEGRFGALEPHWRPLYSQRTLLNSGQFRWAEIDRNGNGLLALDEIGELFRASPAGVSNNDLDTKFPYNIYVADLDGDGLPEIIRPLAPRGTDKFATWGFRKNLGTSFADYTPLVVDVAVDNVTPKGPQIAVFGEAAFTHDLDGDGRAEFLYSPFDPTTGKLPQGADSDLGYVAFSFDHGVGRAAPTNHPLSFNTGGRIKWPGDFNGDGLIDFASSSVEGNGLSLSLNTGAGFVPYNPEVDLEACPIGNTVFTQGFEVSKRDNGLRITDFDGDGDDDLLLLEGPETSYRPNKTNLQVLLSEPSSTNVNFKCVTVQATDGSSIKAGKSAGYVGSGVKGVKAPGYRLSQIGDVDGDGFADILQVNASGELVILRRTKGPAHHLASVTDGRDARTRFIYTPLSNSTFYQDNGGCAYPFRCSRRGQYAVAAQYVDNGGDPKENILLYSYERAIADVTGNGWLGFTKRVVRDLRRSTVTTYEYDPTRSVGNLRPFGGLPTSVQVVTTTGTVKHEVKTNYRREPVPSAEFAASGVFAIRLASTSSTRSETRSGSEPMQVVNVDTVMKYDDYFNETYRRIDTYLGAGGEGQTKFDADVLERTTHYEPVDADAWLISRPVGVVEKHTEKDGSSVTRTSSFTTDPITGLLASQTIEPNGSDDENLSVLYERNAAGQVVSATKTDRAGNVRRDSIVLDQTGLFPAFTVNAVGHTQAFYFHPGYGVPLFVADENMNIVSNTFDGFMRPKQIRYPSGSVESFDYYGAVSTATGPSVRRITSAGTESKTFVDRLGRPKTILSRRNLTGQNYYSYVDIEYDLLGRVKSLSQPYFPEETRVTTKYEYDQLDRLTKLTDPAGAVTSRDYEVRTIRQTEPNLAKREAQVDLHGRLVGVTHNVASPHADIAVAYAPFSQLARVTITDSARGTQERVFGHDVLGRQTTAQETDVGTRTQRFNAFGDVREEVAASGEVLSYQIDALGRVGRIEDKATGKLESFTWDGSEHGLGQVATSTSFDGVASDYEYSATSQLALQQSKIGDVALPISVTYDAQDRVEAVSYPGPFPAASVARYFYDDANGELDAVTFAGSLLWKRVVADAMGRTRREGFANGTLTFTDFNARGDVNSIKTYFSGLPTVQDLEFGYFQDGDLQFRKDHILSTTESFTYDDQRRLHTWSITGGGTTTWEHDGFGNIKSRVNSGDLGLPSVVFNYPASGSNKPISSSLGAVYNFDTHGRVTGNGVHKSIAYTPFDLPSRLEAVKGDVITMSYDANHERASKTGPDAKTLYLGRHYERVERALEPLTHVMHIYGDKALADVVWRDGEPDYELRYLHQDRLGSVEAITDRTGKLVERRKFDPFGAPIDPQRLVPTPFPSAFTAGFTGHSHDPDLGLVNMKGRLFDSAAMRFMTPDPVVSDAADSQAWNPYSYVGQMPFRFTDPTGFQACEICNFDEGDYITADPHLGRSPQQRDAEVPGSRVIEEKTPVVKENADDSGGGITIADLEAMPVSQPERVAPSKPRGGPVSPLFADGPKQILSSDALNDSAQKNLKNLDGMMHVGANLATMVVPFGAAADAALGAAAKPNIFVRAWSVLFPRAATRGRSVLGHFPDYVNKANELGAKRFSIPEKIWNAMSKAEQWAANQKFLDRAIARGDEFVLATPLDKVRAGSYFERELQYLFSKGYQLADDGARLIPGR